MLSDFEIIRALFKKGIDMEYKRVSLNTIERNLGNKRLRFQVHSENQKFKFSELYEDINEAVDKFLFIKRRVDNK